MKKTIVLALSVCILTVAANAQPFKQVGGENNLQLLFTPWGSTPVSLNNGITYRKFNSTGTGAFRVTFSIGSSKSTDVLHQAADTFPLASTSQFPLTTTTTIPNSVGGSFDFIVNRGINPQADQVNKTFSFSIRPGYEKHFAGTDRLSPYIGGELVFTKSSSKSETNEIHEGNYTAVYYDTTTVNMTVQAPYTLNLLTDKTGSTTFGLNLIGGFDFYFAKNLSLGAELNFGYYSTSYSDHESQYVKNTLTSVSNLSPTTFVTTTTVTSTNVVTNKAAEKRGSSSGFGPGVVAEIKLGWLF